MPASLIAPLRNAEFRRRFTVQTTSVLGNALAGGHLRLSLIRQRLAADTRSDLPTAGR